MKRKKLQSIFYMMVLTVSIVTGCGKDAEKTEDSTKIVQVTNVDGNTVTAQVGTIVEKEDKMAEGKRPEGTPPGKPEGGDKEHSAEMGKKPEGTPPALPEGEMVICQKMLRQMVILEEVLLKQEKKRLLFR